MAGTINIDAIRKLSIVERMALIEQIWETISEDGRDLPDEIDEATRTELQRRFQEMKDNPDLCLEHDEVRNWLRSRA